MFNAHTYKHVCSHTYIYKHFYINKLYTLNPLQHLILAINSSRPEIGMEIKASWLKRFPLYTLKSGCVIDIVINNGDTQKKGIK